MKFNIFSVNRYESYLKKYDDDQLTGAKSLHYFMEHYEESLKQFGKSQSLSIFYSSLVNLHNSIKLKNASIGYYDDQLAKADEIRVHVLSQIDQACRDNWLKIYYQPLIDIQNMKLAECEALSRWIDPRYGFLSPDKFILPWRPTGKSTRLTATF
ncbi:EAL domain-containing protein [Lactobacillus delbrueckii subsp. bulgaricus]|nr:EAL domain-containing protein [Lactobacillus delbrueckii]MCD5457301.1 EAL domain-containing protein [Lactobacillus delbrueckii subsp. bulgaricus]MDA3848995.1 EAL domain-containing protein [Lactobacillus delbrueckii]WKZ99106.1 EAL domain-containing protein [Lactobacillus delbrueckii]